MEETLKEILQVLKTIEHNQGHIVEWIGDSIRSTDRVEESIKEMHDTLKKLKK